MVSGAVTPPSLELTNADLIRSHLQAVWLAETNTSLGTSLKDILDITGNPPSLELIDQVKNMLDDLSVRNRARGKAERVIASLLPALHQSDWFNDNWLTQVFDQIPFRFEEACNRWRDLYMAALKQRDLQNAIIGDASRPPADRDRARRLRREAENQIELLLESRNVMQSDFYVYRYFASEGFLPGYNFPRLPLSAYIPARRVKTDEGEYLSRPRFLAVSNRCDVRWVALTDTDGHGLMIVPERPMSMSALHYTAQDLAAARHPCELTPRREVVVCLDAVPSMVRYAKERLGISGDALVLNPDMKPSKQGKYDVALEFARYGDFDIDHLEKQRLDEIYNSKDSEESEPNAHSVVSTQSASQIQGSSHFSQIPLPQTASTASTAIVFVIED